MKTAQLFNTEKEIEEAIASFTTLQEHPGWINFVKILDENIKIVTDQILHKPADATEKDMDRLRDNLALMEEMRNTPSKMIKDLSPNEDGEGSTMVNPDHVYD